MTGEDRAGHYRAIAAHRDQAVEHPGRARANLDAIKAAQARLDADRAEAEAGEPVPTMGGPQGEAEAERPDPEAGD